MPASNQNTSLPKPRTDTLENYSRDTGANAQHASTNAIQAQLSPAAVQNIAAQEAAAQAAKIAKDPYRGRKVIDDAQFQSLLDLGYDPNDLRKTYLPKSQKDLAKKMGDMFWNAPAFQPKEESKTSTSDPGFRAMMTQMVMAPYIRQLGDQFNQQRAGVQATQQQLMQQINPAYQPYLQAMNNAATQAQDTSWANALTSLQTVPVIDQQNQLLQQYIQQLQAQKASGGDDAFLQALMTGQVSG